MAAGPRKPAHAKIANANAHVANETHVPAKANAHAAANVANDFSKIEKVNNQ